MLFAGIEYITLEKRELAFRCSCSRQKIESVLLSIGSEELTEILQKEGGTEVTCEFCREVYAFNREELERLVEELNLTSQK
jgi:molecular chaperone Hsp33